MLKVTDGYLLKLALTMRFSSKSPSKMWIFMCDSVFRSGLIFDDVFSFPAFLFRGNENTKSDSADLLLEGLAAHFHSCIFGLERLSLLKILIVTIDLRQ